MTAATLNLPYVPGADNAGALRAFMLAALVHCVLFGFLYFGIRWQSAPPDVIAAELWTPPQALPVPVAAPKVEAPRAEPKPEPKPEIKDDPKPPPKPDIAEKIEKKKPEVKPPPKPEPKPRIEDDPVKRDLLKEQIARDLQRETLAQAATRDAAAVSAKGSASQNQNWLRAVNSHIERRFVFDGASVSANLEARFEITLAPSLNILNVRLLKPSGNAAFDAAALRAIESASPLPPPTGDKVEIPRTIEVPMRPKKT